MDRGACLATIQKVKVLVTQSCLTLCTLSTVAHQAPLPMEFSRQEYWSGLPFPSPGGLFNPGIKSVFPAMQVDSFLSEPPGKAWATVHGVTKSQTQLSD